MTTRNDVTVDYQQSPRVAEIASPSVEMTMQDLVDTLRKDEDAVHKGISFTKLTDASGKELLGGGVSVGITVSLQDTQVSFEARTTPAQSGVVTTGSGVAIDGTITFIDTSADFVAAGIVRGSMVINYTDQSIADVVEVVNLTTLKTKVLVNGIGNTYDISDVYDVFNVIQCNVLGGNLVAVDNADIIISAILPTAFTQVVTTSSSSATISEQVDIRYSSFGGGVTVDTTSIYTGTTFPVGTPRQPVNNFTDALIIAIARGFNTIFIIGNATISSGPNFTGFSFIGESPNKSLLTIDSSANVVNSEFREATITGTLDGGSVMSNCIITTLNFADGIIQNCVLNEIITLSAVADAYFLDCWSGVPGALTPTINMGGSGSKLAIRNYSGGITLTNKTGSDDVSIDINSGQIIIDNTVTTGTIILRGVGKWANKATYSGGATVVDSLLSSENVITQLDSTLYDGVRFDTIIKDLLSMATGRIVEGPTGTFKFYDQDNSTVAFTLIKAGSERTRV